MVCVRAGKSLTVQPINELFIRLDLGRAWTADGGSIITYPFIEMNDIDKVGLRDISCG